MRGPFALLNHLMRFAAIAFLVVGVNRSIWNRHNFPAAHLARRIARAALFDSDRVGVTCSNLFDSTEAGWWRALRVLIRTPAECAARLSMCRYGERDVQQR